MKRKARVAPPPDDLQTFTPGVWAPFVEAVPPPGHGYPTDADWRLAAEFKEWRKSRARWAEVFGWHTELADRLHDERRQRALLAADSTPPTERGATP